MRVPKLTQRLIERAVPDPKRRVYLWGAAPEGLGLVTYPSGRKVFVVRYKLPNGRRERATIGDWPAWSLGKAVDRARAILFMADHGQSAVTERREARQALTWRAWVTEHYMPAVELRKKSTDDDRLYLVGTKKWGKRPEVPSETMRRWGALRLAEVTPARVEALFRVMAGRGRVLPNRWLASIAACLEAAVQAGHIEANPARRVKKLPPNPPRDRVLTDEEMARFVAALDRQADPFARAFFHVLAETGARSSEVSRMRWEDLDLAGAVWTLKSPKAGRVQHQPMPAPTVRRLAALPRVDNSPWVFPGRDPLKPRAGFREEWCKLIAEAGIAGVTIHDLRRSFGLRVAKAAGLHVASKLLRHSDLRITAAVYAPLGLDDLRPAAEAAAKVLPMRPAKRKARA